MMLNRKNSQRRRYLRLAVLWGCALAYANKARWRNNEALAKYFDGKASKFREMSAVSAARQRDPKARWS